MSKHGLEMIATADSIPTLEEFKEMLDAMVVDGILRKYDGDIYELVETETESKKTLPTMEVTKN